MSRATHLSQRARRAGGQPISFLMHQALAHPDLISLAAGFVDQQTLPVDPARQALDALLSDPQRACPALQYGTTPGHLPLREALLEAFLEADGMGRPESGLSVERVIVTAGSNQMLHLVTDTLCDAGDIVLCTSPSYFVYLGMLSNLGVRSVGVACDDEGLIPEALTARLARIEAAGELARVKAIYIVSYYDNPRGVTLSAPRRAAVVEIARRWSRHGKIRVLEDMAYRELRYFGKDVPSLRAYDGQRDTVIVTQTFSKSFSPGIRVGYGILPADLVEPVSDQKGNVDFGSPNFNQHLMAAVLELGLFRAHVEQIRASYHRKLEAMLSAADEFLAPLAPVRWIRPAGGLYVWLELPDGVETGPAGALFERALGEGVLYVPGEYCYPSEGEAAPPNMIRLSFGVETPAKIREGMAALARAIQSVME